MKQLTVIFLSTIISLFILFATPSCETPDDSGWAAAHNTYRQAVSVANINWSSKVAAYAQDWANTLVGKGCTLEHRSPNSYGENIAWSSGTSFTAQQAVTLWGSEQTDYNYTTNTCATGKACGHYTQMVWANSLEVGCGKGTCANAVVYVCNYSPPGNYVGQKPY